MQIFYMDLVCLNNYRKKNLKIQNSVRLEKIPSKPDDAETEFAVEVDEKYNRRSTSLQSWFTFLAREQKTDKEIYSNTVNLWWKRNPKNVITLITRNILYITDNSN